MPAVFEAVAIAAAQIAAGSASTAADAANAAAYAADLAAAQQACLAAAQQAALAVNPADTGSTLLPSRFCPTTPAERAAAPPMEPALEEISHTPLRSQQKLLWSLEFTVLLVRESCKDGFSTDPAKWFEHKLEQSRLFTAWSAGKVQAEAKLKVDACHKAHGDPTQMLTADWLGLVDQFKRNMELTFMIRYSLLNPISKVLRIADGQLSAETLSHVMSLHEEDRQRAQRPEASRQLGLHLDSTLTKQTREKYKSTMPLTSEGLRDKYAVMTNMWLLAQMRQRGRTMYQDLTKDTSRSHNVPGSHKGQLE